MEKPMKQTRGLFCKCFLGVARCQSKPIAQASELGSCQSNLCHS